MIVYYHTKEMFKVICITGNKYNGKDTVADYLCSKNKYIKLSLAEPLKEVCKILFNFNNAQLYGDLKEEVDMAWNISPRQAMQFIGTEMFRDEMEKLMPDIGCDFWVQSLVRKINIVKDKYEGVVVADVRFDNEIEILRKTFDVLVIKVVRSDIACSDTHASEQAISNDACDIVIYNNSTLENLYKTVEDICLIP